MSIESQILQAIQGSALRNKIDYVALFGSYAKKTNTKNSDIDIMIRLNSPVGFGLLHLENDLSKKLGCKVDLITENGINRHLKHEINKTKKVIYEK